MNVLPILLSVVSLFQVPGNYPGASIDRALRANQYLAALRAAEVEVKNDKEGFMTDMLGLTQSYLSLERETLVTFDSMGAAAQPDVESSPVDDAEALDAIAAIVEAAKDRRIVILNESHHMSRHRAFGAELAHALREIGFDAFAAETFMDVAGTTTRGYADHTTGYYTQDPVFGEMVRTVLGLGYACFAYEATATAPTPGQSQRDRINAREIEQARNLKERIFDVNPDANLFIYVGYSHATEDWRDKGGPNEVAWMAARLAELTGFDPLTIDQTDAMPRSKREFTDPHWRRAVAAGKLDRPRVFQQADGAFFVAGDYAGKVDCQVFHPPLGEVRGRPDWLAKGRVVVELPESILEALDPAKPTLVQAFRSRDSESAIPTDQFVVTAAKAPPALLLPKGEYRVVVQDESGAEKVRAEKLVVD